MDGTQFDALTKRLATGTSRRRVLLGLGSALAGVLARGGVTAAAPGGGASCSSDADCLDGRCVQGHCRFGLGPGGHGGHGGCQATGTICLHNRDCCSGRCTLNSVDPPRGRCA